MSITCPVRNNRGVVCWRSKRSR